MISQAKNYHRSLFINKWNSKQTEITIKQFVVRNCNKQRPASMVTETLKNGILIVIVTSKELYFYADFKYISFKFSLTHQKLRAWENY